MTHPENETLLQIAEGTATSAELAAHLDDCEACRNRVTALTADLAHLTESVDVLTGEAPASLEPRLRWQLRAGATTVRAKRSRGDAVREWMQRHRGMALASSAAAALVVVALLAAGPGASVSASQILERSQNALIEALSTTRAQRIVYQVDYDGPTLEMLPVSVHQFRVEELWDLDRKGSFKLSLTTLDGELLRGIMQDGNTRRIIARTDLGDFDLRFQIDDAQLDLGLVEGRRRQMAESFFRGLTNAADPGRLSHTETVTTHVLELGPRPGRLDSDPAGMFELDGARLVIDRETFRLGSASLSGRIGGEAFHLDADVVSVEPLEPGELVAGDFEFPELPGALVLRGVGTAFPGADVAHLMLQELGRDVAKRGVATEAATSDTGTLGR